MHIILIFFLLIVGTAIGVSFFLYMSNKERRMAEELKMERLREEKEERPLDPDAYDFD